MAKIIWTEPALEDLRDVIDYIAKDSLIYVQRFGTHIVEAPRRLEMFPKSGRIVPEFDDERIRELVFGSYRIIYSIKKDVCYINAVMHASRNILSKLKPGDWDVN